VIALAIAGQLLLEAHVPDYVEHRLLHLLRHFLFTLKESLSMCHKTYTAISTPDGTL
jgi:hypothetical protein